MNTHNLIRKRSLFNLAVIFCLSLGITTFAEAKLTNRLSNGTNVSLIGFGTYKEFRNDIYLAALFAPNGVKKADDLTNANIAKRMSLRLMSDYSNRNMARHWKERLAINNTRETWQPLTQEIIAFSEVFQRKLQVGDEINIDYLPGLGVKIYLNGTLFKTIESSDFMKVLLNVWLGDTPPGKDFKRTIRGSVPQSQKDNFEARFLALVPIKGRFDSDLAKMTSSSRPTAVAAKPAEAKPKPETKKQTQQQKPTRVATIEKPRPAVVPKEPVIDVDLISGSYTRELVSQVQKNQEYPDKAARNNEQGDVTVKVTIDANGEVLEVDLVERSGSRTLDKATVKMVRRAAPFKPIPKELKLQTFEFEIPVSYQL